MHRHLWRFERRAYYAYMFRCGCREVAYRNIGLFWSAR